MRQTTDILQEVAKLIAGAMKKKEFDVDYTALLGSCHPPFNDCTNLLESITNVSTISLRSIVMLSEISENNMNSRKRMLETLDRYIFTYYFYYIQNLIFITILIKSY